MALGKLNDNKSPLFPIRSKHVAVCSVPDRARARHGCCGPLAVCDPAFRNKPPGSLRLLTRVRIRTDTRAADGRIYSGCTSLPHTPAGLILRPPREQGLCTICQ